MTQYFAFSTDSFAFIASGESGGVAALIAPDIAEAFAKTVTPEMAAAERLDILLDLMGDDAEAYLRLLGEMTGSGDAFADAYAKGGIDALLDALDEAGAGRSDFLPGGFGESADLAHMPEGFQEAGETDLSDMLAGFLPDVGVPEGAGDGTGDAPGAVIEALINSQSGLMADTFWEKVVAVGAAAGLGAYWGSKAGLWGAVAGGVVLGGAVAVGVEEAEDFVEEQIGGGLEEKMPSDPTVDGSPSVLTDAAKEKLGEESDPLNPDEGRILTEGVGEKGELPEQEDPWHGYADPEEVEFAFYEMPDFEAQHLEQTTQPDPTDPGASGGPQMPNGGDPSEAFAFVEGGTETQAGATEYIILLVNGHTGTVEGNVEVPTEEGATDATASIIDDMAFV